MTPRTSSAAWVRGIADMFAAEGLPAADLCTEAGIDLPALQQPHTRVDVDRVSRLWEAAAARHGQPGLGLERNLAARYGNVDLVGYALASGPNLLVGFEHLQRQMALISDATTFEMRSDPRGQGYWLALSHIGATRPIPRQRIEFAVLTLFTLCCWLTRRDLVPQAVELTTPPPQDEARYRAAFGLLPRFGQPANRFLLAEADLLAPIPTHNPSLWALHERMVDAELDQLGQTLASTRVRTEIARVLHLGEPRREDIAARLHLTDRTLQRRLQAESVSYQQLLDDTRRELARQHLMDVRRSLAEIADLLGFADQSNLFRACKRWFGMPPGQYRAQVLQAEPEAAS
ncbi:AraC family transcriptional regulator [Acidovorax sp. sic0104]|uniref:AraC family transcriptional regulator n=1 Tax=Acidovorax sp. sic0104 TaxID=2854784 RepID=UPI001C4789CE|nr:AraC family transcriptional regulator [Acidovorax sp. sic0104]MBV7540641.1 AraC family transcriptional regulator [Acidovorax sp. sic0104]